MNESYAPDWSIPANVRALQTTRIGGVSGAPWDSFNLGDHVGDAPEAVAANRALLRRGLPGDPFWLTQVHGTVAVNLDKRPKISQGDAAYSRQPGNVCAVMTADCLPVLFCDRQGSVVAAAHAGWRGLLAGVLESAVSAMQVAPENILAWLGPAIGPACFEVGSEVRDAFVVRQPGGKPCLRADAPTTANGCATSTCWHGSACSAWELRRLAAAKRAPSATADASFPIAAMV